MNKVSVIIINYNTFAITGECVRSVVKHSKNIPIEIILVDNASSERNPDDFLVEFPFLHLVKSKVNGGFAYGNNLGIEKATGDIILLLNSDTILRADSISVSAHYLLEQEGVGVLGCRMVYPDGKIQYSARRFRSIGWELLDLFRFIPLMMPYKKRAKLMLGKYYRHDDNRDCDWINGAYFMFPRKIMERLPLQKLDDRFFMYAEDQLWCEQVRALGYRILFYADTTIVHINSGSTDISKQLKLRRTMMKHELEIVRERKGKGLYYFIFSCIYIGKESTRNFIKLIVFRLTRRLIR